MATTDPLPDEELSEFWRKLVTGGYRPFNVMSRGFRRLPGSPRCKVCSVPLGGSMSPVLRVAGFGPSRMNPRFCNSCETAAERHPGGCEVELSLLFADVRGSTGLAEQMAPSAFRDLMNRFYGAANAVLISSDAMIDKMVGDEVVALYLPLVGADHPRRAIEAARALLAATGHADAGGPWIPVGVGVHTGTAFVGTVGSGDTVTDFTAMGDAVNVTARLASVAGAGEVLVTDAASHAAGWDGQGAERRDLVLRGRSEPLPVTVLTAAAA